MKVSISLVLLFLIVGNTSVAQLCTVKGRIAGVESGTISFIPIIDDSAYYGKDYMISLAQISNGQFEMQRKHYSENFIAYKCSIRQGDNTFLTDIVLLKKGYQEIEITSLDEHTSPTMLTFPEIDKQIVIYNIYFKTFLQQVERYYSFLDSCQDVSSNDSLCVNPMEIEQQLVSFQNESDYLFSSYAKIHTSDVYLFWKLIERLHFKGLQDEYISITKQFPVYLQQSLAGLKLNRDLAKIPILALTKRVLPFSLISLQNEHVNIEPDFFEEKITLIEFWFKGCVPCRRQFEEIKKMQRSILFDDFQVLAISTDSGLEKQEWFKKAGEKERGWLQFLDYKGFLVKNLFINSFPTSYLIDDSGLVVEKNISIADLQEFLFKKYSDKHIYSEHQAEAL